VGLQGRLVRPRLVVAIMSTTRVLVVGAGYGGLAFAALLKRLKRSTLEVKVVERRTRSAWDEARALPVGLWAPACDVLKHLGVRLARLKSKDAPGGCYTNPAGRVLADAPVGQLERTPLRFFANGAALLDAVAEAQGIKVEFGVEAHEAPSIERGSDAASGSRRTRIRLVALNGEGRIYDADFVVVACGGASLSAEEDGVASKSPPIAPAIGEHPNFFHFSLGSAAAPALPCDYVVYRGLSDAALRPVFPSVAFQAWGPGMRFAAVPLPQGSVWFATFPQGHSLVPRALYGAQEGRVSNGPTLDNSLLNLRGAFLGWHEPIDELLTATTKLWVDHAAASAFPWRRPARGTGRFVRLGDAAFTYDPILAIGAGEAISDAAMLASLLEEKLDRPTLDLDDGDLEAVRKTLSASQWGRNRMLSLLSCTAGKVGQTHFGRSRDLALSVIPRLLKRAIFGWSIRRLGR